MKTVYNIKDLPKKYRYIFTIGNFDGFHRGHQKVLRALVKQKKVSNEKTLVVTFVSHPRDMDGDYQYLTNKKDSQSFFQFYNIDYVLKLEFQAVKNIAYQDFLRWLNNTIDIKTMILTEKLRIGYNRKGTLHKIIKTLQSFDNEIEVKLVKLLMHDDKPISSTEIKKLIRGGHIRLANKLLGYDYLR